MLMYTPSDFKLIRRNCPNEMTALLNNLGIKNPDFNAGDEYEIYSQLDDTLDKKISEILKSKSVLEGYTKLLDLGGVAYSTSETRVELLGKILANREKILQAASVQDKNSAQTSNNLPLDKIGALFLLTAAGYYFMSDEPNNLITGALGIAGIAGIGFSFASKSNDVEPQSQIQFSPTELKNIFPILDNVKRIFDLI